MAMVAILALDSVAEAGPFRRSVATSNTQACTSGSCGTTTSVERSRTVVRGTSTAQGVAEIQAAEGRRAHHGGNTGYEGVGSGPTPEAALANCCSNGRAAIDQGVAQSRDGRWYACRRYAR
jgi:hypothetical protein